MKTAFAVLPRDRAARGYEAQHASRPARLAKATHNALDDAKRQADLLAGIGSLGAEASIGSND
jgi:hypothetical protein